MAAVLRWLADLCRRRATDFDAIDRHALAAPADCSVRRSNWLNIWCSRRVTTPTRRGQFFAGWPSMSRYDVASYLAGTIVPQSASDADQRQGGVLRLCHCV